MDLQPAAGPALVIGGGAIALRKVRNLVQSEFEIVVVAPLIHDEIRLAPFTTVHERVFEDADLTLREFALVFACTDDRDVNRRAGQLARAARIPVVVADAAGESTFFTPATLRDGDIAIAVSTGGTSPTLARKVREEIVKALGPAWAHLSYVAGNERRDRAERRARRVREPQE
jgi:siroheme synthase-like protein